MHRLTQFVLASSCLMVILPSSSVLAVLAPIAADTDSTATNVTAGVSFNAAANLKMLPGVDLGNTLGVSATSTIVAVDSIIFQGSSTVTGSIIPTLANHLDSLELQGGLGTTVTLNGLTTLNPAAADTIKFTTLAGSALVVNQTLTLVAGQINFDNFGALSTVTFASGANFDGKIDTTTPGTGSVIFNGNSTVTTGALGKTNALLAVNLGPGTVYLNTGASTHKANNFNFTDVSTSSILKLADTVNITGDIDNITTPLGNGTLIFEGDSTITGKVGSTSPSRLGLIQLADVAAKTVTFTSTNVNANTIQLLNTGLINENTLVFDGVAAKTTVNANIITATNNSGIIDLKSVSTFTGNIGSSSLSLKTIKVGELGDATINGDIYSKKIEFQNTKDLIVNGNIKGDVDFSGQLATLKIGAGSVIDGNVDDTVGFGFGNLVFLGSSSFGGKIGATNTLTTLDINGGTFSYTGNSDINATTVTVRNGATLAFNQETILSNDLVLDPSGGNLQLGNNTVNVGNDFTAAANSVINLDLASDAKFGKIVTGNQATINAGTNFQITTSGYIPNGKALTIVTSPVLAIANKGTVSSNNLLTSFALDNFTDVNKLTLIVTRNPNASIADYPFTAGVAGALDSIQNAPLILANPEINAVISQLDNYTSRAGFNEGMASLAPSVEGDNLEGMMALTRLGVETIRERLDSYRLGQLDYYHTGYSAGNYNRLKDYGVWVKLLASRLKQTEYQGIDGYKADVTGITGGIDYTSPDEEMVYGIGLNYSTTDSLSRAKAASENKIDSYALMLYGTYNFNNPWYLDGILYFSQHNYQQTRNVAVGPVSQSAKAEYAAWQMSARAETGFVYQYNKILFQPTLGLFYSHLDRDNYTETGAGGLNLVNRPRDVNSLRLSAGPKISTVLGSEGASVVPEFHAYYNFELINASKEQYLSNFAVGGPTFVTNGIENKRSSYVAGVGLAAYGFENLSCHISLDYEFNETKFSALHGSLKFKYTW